MPAQRPTDLEWYLQQIVGEPEVHPVPQQEPQMPAQQILGEPEARPPQLEFEFEFIQTPWVLARFLWGWELNVPEGHADPRVFLEEVRPRIRQKLEEGLREVQGLKFQLHLKVRLRKANPDSREELADPVFRHKQKELFQAGEIDEVLDREFATIQETLEQRTQRGSGWVVDGVETLWLDIGQLQPLRGGSYIHSCGQGNV